MFILIPYRHESLTLRRLPWITFGLIAINVIIYLIGLYCGPNDEDMKQSFKTLFEYYADHPYLELPQTIRQLVPKQALKKLDQMKEEADEASLADAEVQDQQQEMNRLADAVIQQLRKYLYWEYGHRPVKPYLWSYFTSMFLHAGFLHLFGNMLFLFLAGCSIEDLWGRPLFLCFYLSAGILSTLAHDLRFPDSEMLLVGASGAIAGLMGAFMVRLYKTRISFYYNILLFVRGRFQAPAWLVLPLWLVQQLFLSSIVGEEAHVAFLAHVGGFVFGALFAVILDLFRFEDKYVNAYVENQVGIAQNPLFLKAMDLSQKSDFVQAVNLLKQVVQKEPDHVEAYMELRRIFILIKDPMAYDHYTGGMLEALIRNRQHEMIPEFYRQCLSDRNVLPVRSLLTMGAYLEEVPDYRFAMDVYQKLIEQHPDDQLVLKAYSKMARLCMDRLMDTKRATELLVRAYGKAGSGEWASILRGDFKRYGIPLPAAVIPEKPAPVALSSNVSEPVAFLDMPAEPEIQMALPNSAFDGQKGGWNPVICSLERIEPSGLILQNQQEMEGSLSWGKIKMVSVGRIRVAPPGATKPEKDFLMLDLIPKRSTGDESTAFYRIRNQSRNPKKIFPSESMNSLETFRKMMELILEKSLADCAPDREKCVGPQFAVFSSLSQYESQIKTKVLSHDS